VISCGMNTRVSRSSRSITAASRVQREAVDGGRTRALGRQYAGRRYDEPSRRPLRLTSATSTVTTHTSSNA
jgi:hypothetical protein